MELLAPGPAPGCKFMANRVAVRVAFLEARMLGFAAALEAAEGAPASMPVHMPSQACLIHLLLSLCSVHGLVLGMRQQSCSCC